ncbi:MAG: adenylate/guanylate cyclase domain-containing protein [Ignavibacteriaceae bacterium]
MTSKANILICEDEGIIAKDLSSTLKRLGYDVAGIARSGDDVIKKAHSLSPNLILMDIMLEGELSGIEASKKIQANLDIPIIYLTALVDEDTLHNAKITEPFGYLLKPFDERSLHSSIEMALYKHNINLKLKQKTLELEIEKRKTDNLLHNILPIEIVEEFKENGKINPREYKMVTLLFTDFQGFSSISSQMSASDLVEELNDIFQNFDATIENHGLEKLKTIGDSYMVGGGFPKENDNHAINSILAAMEMNEYLHQRNLNSKYKWVMRAGIHSGSVVAGVIGKNKFTYDVWGDTVNIASRMEQKGKPGKINITSATFELIKDHFECEPNGIFNLMDNGSIEMHFITRKKNKNIILNNTLKVSA